MIEVTRFDGSHLIVNADLIEFIETTPDTVISLTTQRKILVRESAQEIVDRVIAFKRRIYLGGPDINPPWGASAGG
ncbi:MAG: flagellar FlbD family protein [Chloroflexi bacterium]|nr:flagellar FlbD family protein [Chloroflexota bacterium]